ncbi:hypothetical protein [Stutzerimonas urumqiensis]|uniref:hypothetical protein n=1 Tax=Stutzerimonas urumqiensis TaxID=638269 RepID=UPI0013CED162|nr:hypothetical protein [Stutzerimonas urumqiensis]
MFVAKGTFSADQKAAAYAEASRHAVPGRYSQAYPQFFPRLLGINAALASTVRFHLDDAAKTAKNQCDQ